MFSDIVASTERAVSMGDAGGAIVPDRHDALVPRASSPATAGAR